LSDPLKSARDGPPIDQADLFNEIVRLCRRVCQLISERHNNGHLYIIHLNVAKYAPRR